MDTQADFQGDPKDRVLLVLLPGAYDVPKDYFANGFISEIRRRGLAVDIIAADAHVDYYTGRNVVERLHEDVLLPAREKGYRRVWLGGISLGGFGSLLYVHSYPKEVDGVLLLAPYLGARNQVQDIARAGGLARWQPKRDDPLDEEREMLQWLQTLLAPGHEPPALYLGYGASDRFARSISVLAQAMPPERVMEIEGGHDWPTWSKLWSLMLDKKPFN
ncbi:MAG: serine aminopeptidase domain-containing protein [Burkholderiales bacterium]